MFVENHCKIPTRENPQGYQGAARPTCHLQASCEKGCKPADLGCDSRRIWWSHVWAVAAVAMSSQGAPNRTPKCHWCRWMAPIHLGDLDKLQDSPGRPRIVGPNHRISELMQSILLDDMLLLTPSLAALHVRVEVSIQFSRKHLLWTSNILRPSAKSQKSWCNTSWLL